MTLENEMKLMRHLERAPGRTMTAGSLAMLLDLPVRAIVKNTPRNVSVYSLGGYDSLRIVR
jgi:hypothetical protein